MKFGLIGYPLTHSFSKKYFEQKFQTLGLTNFSYDNFSIEKLSDVLPILRSDVFGLNVTIPHKTSIIEYLSEIDPVALQIGAVNTLVRTGDYSWKGYNTDHFGFRSSLEEWMKGHQYPERALIFGSGGAAKAIRFTLSELGIYASTVSRSYQGDYFYKDLTKEIMESHLLLINATPLGMDPRTDTSPMIPYEYLTAQHWLYDVVYNPPNTLFLTRGQQMGAHTKNGLDMLHLQAEQAWLTWKSYGKF